MREDRPRKTDGWNGEEMMIKEETGEAGRRMVTGKMISEEGEVGRRRRRRETEKRRRTKHEQGRKSQLSGGQESIWKDVGESLNSKAQLIGTNFDAAKKEVKTRGERREPIIKNENSKAQSAKSREDQEKTKRDATETWERNAPMRPKRTSGNSKNTIDAKEADTGGGRMSVSRLFSTKKNTKKKEEEELSGKKKGNQILIQDRSMFEARGGKARERKRRRGDARGEIEEEMLKKVDGRRSLKKWLGRFGRESLGLGRESLAESLSRGHVCRVHR